MNYLQPLLITVVFGVFLGGAGILLVPALPPLSGPTRAPRTPRIALAATLALAVVIVGTLVWATLFGSAPATVDRVWFALIAVVLLIGLFVWRQDRRQSIVRHWPGQRELAFFGVALLGFLAPVLFLPVPLDTDAQGFGYLALMLRDSGSLTTLAPFHPEIDYLYAHGFLLLVAHLSRQLGIGLHTVQFAASAVLSLLLIGLLYDLGNTVEDWLSPLLPPPQPSPAGRGGSQVGRVEPPSPPLRYAGMTRHAGMAMAILGILGTGLLTAYLDSHFTTVLALVFSLGFLLFITRILRGGALTRHRWVDPLGAIICLAAVPLTHPDTTIILVLGYVPWLVTIGLARPRPTLRQWVLMTVVVPLGALLLVIPWALELAPLLGSDIASPFEINPQHWKVLVFMHGGLIVPLALGGAWIAVRRRTPLDLLMVGWLLLILDFSTTGVLARVLPWLFAPLLKYDYPFSIAWHGPIIPYAYLGTSAVLWLAGRIGSRRVQSWVRRSAWPVLGLGLVVILLVIVFSGQVLALSKGRISFFGAFSSHADVQAMDWLRDNTPPETRVLNFPGPQEGDWVPVITERDTVFFRPQPFFSNMAQAEAEQSALIGFWQNPADLVWLDRLRGNNIDYVLVPQVVGDPDSFAQMWRWQEPFAWQVEMASAVDEAAYLELVADFNGAQVYRVVGLNAE